MDDDSKYKKYKGENKYVIKRKLRFKNYKVWYLKNKSILKSQQIFKSNDHIIIMYKLKKSTRLR